MSLPLPVWFAAMAVPAPSPTPDEELIQAMTRGDQRALGILYERYAVDVRRAAGSIVRDPSLAGDLVQDIFLEIWRHAEKYDASRGTVRCWLMVRARSRALDRVRKASRHREVELTEAPADTANPPSADRLQLPRAFEHISAEDREIVVLGYAEGYTCQEIAERLGMPVGTVKSRTRRAMVKLRSYWDGESP